MNTGNVRSVNIAVWSFGNGKYVNCTKTKNTVWALIITETNGAIMSQRGLDEQIVDSCT
jgi:hypothetical protein